MPINVTHFISTYDDQFLFRIYLFIQQICIIMGHMHAHKLYGVVWMIDFGWSEIDNIFSPSVNNPFSNMYKVVLMQRRSMNFDFINRTFIMSNRIDSGKIMSISRENIEIWCCSIFFCMGMAIMLVSVMPILGKALQL